MVFIPANNVLMVEMRGSQFAQEIENTLYFQHTGAITASAVDALFDFIELTMIPAFKDDQATTFSWDELYGTDLTTATSPTYSRSFVPPIAGTGSGAAMPNSVATVTSFRTAGRGRSSRGRNFFPGLTENYVTGNEVALAVINDIVAAYELLMGGGTFPSAWVWVVLSRFLDGSPRAAGLAQAIVDVLSTSLTVETQRGRLR